MASVTERISPRTGESSWRVQFRIGKRLVQESFGDPIGAHEFGRMVDRMGGAAARRVLDMRRKSGADVPTLRQFTLQFLDPNSGMLTGIEPGTRAGYRRAAELSFLQVLGEYPVDAIERTDVGKWVAWQESQPSTRSGTGLVAAKTVKNYHGLLSSVMKAAIEAKLRDDNPAYKTRLTRGTKKEAVFLSPAEFKTLLHFTPDYYKPLVQFLASTGLRWGEAIAVTWSDVNLWAATPTVRVNKAYKKGETGVPVLGIPKSSKANRTVSMSPSLVAALGEPQDGDRLLFPGKLSGGHIWYARFLTTTWNKAVAKAMDRELCVSLGLTPLTRRPTPHDLRHTHASWMIAAGIPLPYIQARLGHEKITTTVDVYGHLVPDAHERMATAIAETLDVELATPALPAGALEALEVLDAEVVEVEA